MSRPVLTVAVAVSVLLAAACASASPATVSPAPRPSATVTGPDATIAPTHVRPTQAPPTSPALTSVPTRPASAMPTPAAAGTLGNDPTAALEPGIYRVANPPMQFTIPEPTDDMRWYGAADPAGGFVIRHANDPCDGCEEGQIAVIVAGASVDIAVAEWTTAAGAHLSGVEPAELGGATGVRFEGVLPTEQNVIIVHGGFNPHGYVAVYALGVGTQAVVVAINQYERQTDFVDDARPVVESFRFDV